MGWTGWTTAVISCRLRTEKCWNHSKNWSIFQNFKPSPVREFGLILVQCHCIRSGHTKLLRGSVRTGAISIVSTTLQIFLVVDRIVLRKNFLHVILEVTLGWPLLYKSLTDNQRITHCNCYCVVPLWWWGNRLQLRNSLLKVRKSRHREPIGSAKVKAFVCYQGCAEGAFTGRVANGCASHLVPYQGIWG